MKRKSSKANAAPTPVVTSPMPVGAGGGGLKVFAIPGGVEFDVLATPGSSVSKIRGVHGTALKVALRSPPEKGKANEELVELLAAALNIPARQVSVVRGQTSRNKRLRVLGVSSAGLVNLAKVNLG